MRGLVRAAAAGVVAALLVLSPAAVAGPRKPPPVDTANAGGCDFLDQARCMFPFPNDYFTRRDEGTPTHRQKDAAVPVTCGDDDSVIWLPQSPE